MAFANVLLAVRADAQVAIRARRVWDEAADGPYSGPVTDREAALFKYMHDLEGTERLWKTATFGGNDWNLWNLRFTQNLPKVKTELDQLLADRPNHIAILGAFKWDGAQHGTEHTYAVRTVTKTWSVLNPDYQPDDQEPDYDPRFVLRVTGDVEEEYINGFTGTPVFVRPITEAQMLRFMPDKDDIGTPATELSDVNLAAGQAPRQFG